MHIKKRTPEEFLEVIAAARKHRRTKRGKQDHADMEAAAECELQLELTEEQMEIVRLERSKWSAYERRRRAGTNAPRHVAPLAPVTVVVCVEERYRVIHDEEDL